MKRNHFEIKDEIKEILEPVKESILGAFFAWMDGLHAIVRVIFITLSIFTALTMGIMLRSVLVWLHIF